LITLWVNGNLFLGMPEENWPAFWIVMKPKKINRSGTFFKTEDKEPGIYYGYGIKRVYAFQV